MRDSCRGRRGPVLDDDKVIGLDTEFFLGEVVDVGGGLLARHAVAGEDADLTRPLLAQHVDDLLHRLLVGG